MAATWPNVCLPLTNCLDITATSCGDAGFQRVTDFTGALLSVIAFDTTGNLANKAQGLPGLVNLNIPQSIPLSLLKKTNGILHLNLCGE